MPNRKSPPCLLPGWDSCDESQSPPIENDEWLAFLHRSMQEILDGELDSLKQQNLVSIIVAPLRNSKASPKVLESVAQLLSLPLVLGSPTSVLDCIQSVRKFQESFSSTHSISMKFFIGLYRGKTCAKFNLRIEVASK